MPASLLPPSLPRYLGWPRLIQRGEATFLFLSSCWLPVPDWTFRAFRAEWDPTAPSNGPSERSVSFLGQVYEAAVPMEQDGCWCFSFLVLAIYAPRLLRR